MNWGIPPSAQLPNAPVGGIYFGDTPIGVGPNTSANLLDVGLDIGPGLGSTGKAPVTASTGFGDFSKMASKEESNKEATMTVADYMKQFEEEANKQDAARAAGIDPRGYSSRAMTALKNLLGGSNYAADTAEGRSAEAENLSNDVFTLMDPTAWVANTAGVADPGSTIDNEGEYPYSKYPNLTIGQTVTTKDGKVWKFKGAVVKDVRDKYGYHKERVNTFDFITDPAKLKPGQSSDIIAANNAGAAGYLKTYGKGFAH